MPGARGGYYALVPKRRSVPGFVKWFMGITSSMMLLVFFFVTLSAGSVLGAYMWITNDLPSVDNVREGGIQFETSRIYDRYGNLLYDLYDTSLGKRTHVSIDKLPLDFINATIAVEDSSFQENNGVDPLGIIRAAWINYTEQGTSGGSTITQQVVRRILLPEGDERTFYRKIREAIMAVRMTEKYSKDKILEIYVNDIYYGSLAYGVAAAAETYWGKPVKDLTLAQSAMLAGLPQAPGDFDLNVNFNLAKDRQKIVLDLMVKNNYITQEQADLAYAEDIQPRVLTPNIPSKAPHFVEYARQLLIEKYGPDKALRGGLRVVTTIDLDWQAEAEKIAAAQIQNIRRQGASNAGLVAINPRTGEILAMVGSIDYSNPVFGQVNVATSLRQPGSSFKPITYAAALERGDYQPYTIVPDLPAQYTNGARQLAYVPRNYDGRFHGPVTLKAALANSYNIPAVEVLEAVGVPAVIDLAHRLGITTLNEPERYGLSLTLGGGEVKLVDMTAAFATLANYGYRVPATPFLKVVDGDGKVLEEVDLDRPVGKQVLDSGVAYQISSILSDNQARAPIFGPSSPLYIPGIEAAAKTGTTDDWKDSWTMGYTPGLAVGVWVGNNDGRRMSNVAGAIGAAPIWHNFIRTIYSDPKLKSRLYAPGTEGVQEKFVPPPGMMRAAVCAVSGMAPTSACTNIRYEYFTAGNLPTEVCDWHRWMPVTLSDGGARLAGQGVPPQDVIERIYTTPPKEYRGWIGGGPPGETLVMAGSTAQIPMPAPTPVVEEPASIADLVTPVPSEARGQADGPAGLEEENVEPIPGLQLAIYSPTRGQTITGLVVVSGEAAADDFARYRLEYGFGTGEVPMTAITESTARPVFSTLGLWATDGLQPGTYTLRLTVETNGGSVVRRNVVVRVGIGSPSVTLVSPTDGQPVYEGEVLDIVASPDGAGAPIAGVEIYVDGRRLVSLTSEPWSARWAIVPGQHSIEAIVYTATGERAYSGAAYITSQGIRPTPTPTSAPIMWISRPTLYQDMPAGDHEIWIDVSEGSRVQRVDIYINGLPGGYATGPGYRVNPLWTPTPTPTNTPGPPMPTNTLSPEQIAPATEVAATQEAQSTRVARATQTTGARMAATATAQKQRENDRATATAQSADATASVVLLTSTATPIPPTSTPSATPTPTFIVYEKLLDPMLGDYIARIRLTPGRHRITAIGYDANNQQLDRDETWVVVR